MGRRQPAGRADRLLYRRPVLRRAGNLYIVDIPFGRIFRISPDRKWTLVVEYDGWPNGLKIGRDGRILVADYMHGIMELDAQAGRMKPVLTSRNSESFKRLQRSASCSEWRHLLHRSGPDRSARSDGAGVSADADGRLDCLIDTGISPNGLVLDPQEAVLFVAMTRDNAVWRMPFMKDGSVSKVGRFCSMFGPSGPDGMTMDKAGRLFVAHASLGHVFVFAPERRIDRPHQILRRQSCTNVAIGGSNSDRLYITESVTGTVLVADISVLDR